jgi:hypothetical protein
MSTKYRFTKDFLGYKVGDVVEMNPYTFLPFAQAGVIELAIDKVVNEVKTDEVEDPQSSEVILDVPKKRKEKQV